jgi:outer membrane efflux protein
VPVRVSICMAISGKRESTMRRKICAARGLIFLLLLPAPLIQSGCSKEAPPQQRRAAQVTVAQAEAQQKQLLATYERTIQNAFREVDDALVDQLKSRERLAAQGRQVAALRDYARLSRLRYEGGYTSYLEVLDAERSLFSAELGYAQTQFDLFNALVNVYKAMGGGWVDEADKLAPRPAVTMDAPAR